MREGSLTSASASTADDRKQMLWQVLAAIPPGRVSSYGRLAQLAGLGRGARLVGRWLGQLPDATNLPWHRVLNSQGHLSLPADSASGQEQYQRLMAEGVIIRNRRVSMTRYGWPDLHTGDK